MTAESGHDGGERLWRAMLQSTDAMVVAFDHDLRFIEVNPAFRDEYARIFGPRIDPGDSLLHTLGHCPRDRRNARALVERALAGQSFCIDHPFGDPQRARRVYQILSNPLCAVGGEQIGGVHVIHDVTARVTAEQELRRRFRHARQRARHRADRITRLHRQLRDFAIEVTHIEQRERRCLGEVLHDGLQQMLVAIRWRLTLLRQADKAKRLKPLIDETDALVAQSLDCTRSLTAQLSPAVLHRAGLVPAVQWLGREVARQHGLTVNVDAPPAAEPPDPLARDLLFHGARELLFNVVKHAGVSEANLRLACTPGRHAELVVEDAGCGFDPAEIERAAAEGSVGLAALRRRLHAVGGKLHIETRPGAGARTTLSIPLRL